MFINNIAIYIYNFFLRKLLISNYFYKILPNYLKPNQNFKIGKGSEKYLKWLNDVVD